MNFALANSPPIVPRVFNIFIEKKSLFYRPMLKKTPHNQSVCSVDQPYVDGIADFLHYLDRLKLDRPVDRTTSFS